MTTELYAKMAQSVIDGEDDTAAELAQQGTLAEQVADCLDALDEALVEDVSGAQAGIQSTHVQ